MRAGPSAHSFFKKAAQVIEHGLPGRYGDADEHCHRAFQRRSTQFAARAAVARRISVADLRWRARSRIQAQKFRREPAAHTRESMPGDPHRHRILSDGRDGPGASARSNSQPHPDTDHHSDSAHRTRGEFLAATPPNSRAAYHRHHDHIRLERGGRPNHCHAGRGLAVDSLCDFEHRFHLLHERVDFLSCSRGQRRRDAGVFGGRHRADIAGP